MVDSQPASRLNVIPPCWISLVACHDNVVHHYAPGVKQLFLDFIDTPCKDRERREAVDRRYIAAPTRKITASNMGGDPLCERESALVSQIREVKPYSWRLFFIRDSNSSPHILVNQLLYPLRPTEVPAYESPTGAVIIIDFEDLDNMIDHEPRNFEKQASTNPFRRHKVKIVIAEHVLVRG